MRDAGLPLRSFRDDPSGRKRLLLALCRQRQRLERELGRVAAIRRTYREALEAEPDAPDLRRRFETANQAHIVLTDERTRLLEEIRRLDEIVARQTPSQTPA